MQILRRDSTTYPGPPASRGAARDPAQYPTLYRPDSAAAAASLENKRVLIVDDEASIRLACRCALEFEGLRCDEAGDGLVALGVACANPPALVLLDVDLPGMSGTDVCRELRATFPSMHLKIILISGRTTADDLARMLSAGADDVINKPFSTVQLQARVKAALHRQEGEIRSEQLNRELRWLNRELADDLTSRVREVVHSRNALVLGLTKLAGYRDDATGGHLTRVSRFCVCLAEEAAASPSFRRPVDERFIEALGACAPLHDIGKVGLPDHILLKPGTLTPDERLVMQAHTVIGYETLKAAAEQHDAARGFFEMAMDIARHHHERHDGRGYPDGLAGDDIPLAARLVAVCDVYDALRSPRVYKPALPHEAAIEMMTRESTGQFDPGLLALVSRCAPRFEQIYIDVTGGPGC